MKSRPQPSPRRNVGLATVEENSIISPELWSTRAKIKKPPPPVPAATIRDGIEEQFAMPRLTNLPDRDIMEKIRENCNKLPIRSQYSMLVSIATHLEFCKLIHLDN